MELKCKPLEMFASVPTVVMHPADCMVLVIKDNDRVALSGPAGNVSAVMMCSESLAEPGTILATSAVMRQIGVTSGDNVDVVYSPAPESVRVIRKKMDGGVLDASEIESVVRDISAGVLSDIEVSAWLTALHINGMNLDETADFARAMVATGETVPFEKGPVFDFHSMGGVPGNKVTPIVVSICAAAGLTIPKTSSRAISSACGTSDFVETFCNIEVTTERLREIVESVGGAFVWGGSMNLAPVDDIVIRVEHPLGINPRSKMLASILAKKLAMNSNYLVIDIPTGEGTKVPTIEVARAYARDFMEIGSKLGMHVECAITYADQPVGSAIGPNLEARECISILEGAERPISVIEKACECAGILLEMAGYQNGADMAHEILRSGKAHKKFLEIVVAQGGRSDLKSSDLQPGKYSVDILSPRAGYVRNIRNRDLVAIAKACGASADKGAGLLIHKKKGQRVESKDLLMTLYAESESKLERARELAERYAPIEIEGMLIKRMTDTESR